MEKNTETARRQTSAETNSDESTIHLDKNFFKLKNDDRRNAVLQHEVAHTKLHSMKGDTDNIDKTLKTNKFINELISDTISYYVENAKKLGISEKEAREQATSNIKGMAKKLTVEYQKGGLSKDEFRKKLRESAIAKLSKYKKSSNNHINTREFEADRYAVNKSSSAALKKGIRQYNKLNSKDVDDKKYAKHQFKISMDTIDNMNYSDDIKKEARKNTLKNKREIINSINKQKPQIKKAQNKLSAEDYNARMKALKDKSLTQKEKENYQ